MKVLLRNFNGDGYVWKDATFENNYFVVDGDHIYESNVVSVMDDNRGNYVRCSACGKVFEKDSPEIEEHKNRYKDVNTCFNCRNMRSYDVDELSRTYELLDDGMYKVTMENKSRLYCGYRHYYDYPDIGTVEAQNGCRYKACGDATYNEFEDIFTRNPGIFDDIITVDKIIKAGYKSITSAGVGCTGYYWLKGRNKIAAHVNSLSIVDYFEIEYYSCMYRVVYSKKLNKLFALGGANYSEWNPSCVSDSAKEYIRNKIAKLYN